MKKASSGKPIQNAYSFINNLGSSGMNFDLSRMERVMAVLGNPQDSYPSIHIAGTNGKGSVAAMISNALIKSSVRTGLYTSPHLSDLRERFQVNGKMIHPGVLARLGSVLRSILRSGEAGVKRLTQFEFLTALAFMFFSEQNVQVAVVEVGLGGRLDATNVLRNVLASVITTIDLDHTNWLGRTIRKIAKEKAGIIKQNVPVVTGTTGAAFKTISKAAQKKSAPLHHVSNADVGDIHSRLGSLVLKGCHQAANAAVAFQTLKLLQSGPIPLQNSSIIQGIKTAHWPGRFEVFRISWKGKRRTVILDGAHNPAATKVLVDALKRLIGAKVSLLFGVLKDKDFKSMISLLAPQVVFGFVVPISSDRATDEKSIAAQTGWRGRMRPESSPERGFRRILERTDESPILVTGSLYLVGEIRGIIKKYI